jgi:chromosomal replication initiator protein
VVLIDDVQFLAGRDKTREEFFHTFNALVGSGRQLVISSDRSPEELMGLEARLVERFRAGLVAELEPPPADVRRAILVKRSCLDNVEVSSEVLTEIARHVDSSVRALEGALIRVVAYASYKEEEPTPAMVRHLLRRLGQEGLRDEYSLSEIVDATAQEFGVAPASLRSKSQQRQVSLARQVAMYLARKHTDHSYTDIGKGIGGRDHSTALKSVDRVKAALLTDADVRRSVENLERRLARPA